MDVYYYIFGECWEDRMATLNRLAAGVSWEKPADLSNKETRKRLSPSGAKAFLKIAELWELRDEDARQLLGGMSNGAFYESSEGSLNPVLYSGVKRYFCAAMSTT